MGTGMVMGRQCTIPVPVPWGSRAFPSLPQSANSQQPSSTSIDNNGDGSWHLLGTKIVAKRHPLEHRFPPPPGASIGRRGSSNWHPSGAKASAIKAPLMLQARSVLGLEPTTSTAPYFLSILLPVLLAVLWPFYRPFLAGTKGPSARTGTDFCPFPFPFKIRSKSVPVPGGPISGGGVAVR